MVVSGYEQILRDNQSSSKVWYPFVSLTTVEQDCMKARMKAYHGIDIFSSLWWVRRMTYKGNDNPYLWFGFASEGSLRFVFCTNHHPYHTHCCPCQRKYNSRRSKTDSINESNAEGVMQGFCYKGVFGFDFDGKPLSSSPLLVRSTVVAADLQQREASVRSNNWGCLNLFRWITSFGVMTTQFLRFDLAESNSLDSS